MIPALQDLGRPNHALSYQSTNVDLGRQCENPSSPEGHMCPRPRSPIPAGLAESRLLAPNFKMSVLRGHCGLSSVSQKLQSLFNLEERNSSAQPCHSLSYFFKLFAFLSEASWGTEIRAECSFFLLPPADMNLFQDYLISPC